MPTPSAFSVRLAEQVLIGDGAMGTMLYEQGVFVNTCYDELNLTAPQLIQRVHQSYIAMNVDFIETNTFGANESKLARYGLADKVEAINEAAVRLARECIGEMDIMLAGAMGPVGHELAPYGRMSRDEAYHIFHRQAVALIRAGVDFVILETFSNADELLTAVHAAYEAGAPAILAQMTINERSETRYNQRIDEAMAPVAQDPAVTAVGLNCSVGPIMMLNGLELLNQITDKPIALQPNAGLPKEVDNRTIYMTTPEYMAEYGKRFFEKGARIIGGCCGTTPTHIDQIARAVRALDRAQANASFTPSRSKVITPHHEEVLAAAIPLAERSRIGAKLARKEPFTSIEIIPPRGVDLSSIIEKAQLCVEHGIDAINIPDGPRASSRVSPLATAVEIQRQTGLETILHVCCRDRNLIGMQSDMLGAYVVGLRNVLLITGDPPKLGEYPDATAVFDLDAVGLTALVQKLNAGVDIGGNSYAPPIGLTVGVGANPVASDLDREVERFKRKVDAGAEYAITQPVFEPRMLIEFMEKTESHRIPIVAGLWPFTSYKNAEFMANEVPGVVVPPILLDRMSKAQTREQGWAIGIEIAREMVEAITPYVAGLAVSAPFGNARAALAVLGKIDIGEV